MKLQTFAAAVVLCAFAGFAGAQTTNQNSTTPNNVNNPAMSPGTNGMTSGTNGMTPGANGARPGSPNYNGATGQNGMSGNRTTQTGTNTASRGMNTTSRTHSTRRHHHKASGATRTSGMNGGSAGTPTQGTGSTIPH